MKKLRLWAQILGNTIVFMAIVFLGLFAASSADAQIENWEYPGQYRYRGTSDNAGRMLVQKTNISFAEYVVGVAKQKAGQCREYYLQDGEVVTTTFTRWDGTHHTDTVRVAFKYPLEHELAGESLPTDHPTRRAVSCSTGNADGLAVLLPDVCENWSVHQVTPPSTASGELVCRPGPVSEPIHSVIHQHLDGQVSRNCYGNNYVTAPGLTIHLKDTLEMPAQIKLICDWE